MIHKSKEAAEQYYRDVLSEDQLEGTPAEKAAYIVLIMRELCRNDLYFLLTEILNRDDVRHEWLFDRCMEVQTEPNNMLDLWAREHRKSTIITFALSVQDILCDPEITIGIFSISSSLAKDFLEQIKTEFEDNQILIKLFPEILYANPKRESSKWSIDAGICVKRKTNPRERTVEAFGFIEGLPTGKHFQIRMYDDMIDEKNVTQPEVIKKAKERWELSLNLGSDRIVKRYGIADIARYAGTRYHANDPYADVIKKETAVPRIHPATDNGKPDGNSVYFTPELLKKKLKDMGPYTAACQLFLDPKADEIQGFEAEWFKYWRVDLEVVRRMNMYIVVDPASSKKDGSDFTCMWVVGLAEDDNYYLIDGLRDRINLVQRAEKLTKFHRMYKPISVGYESYGMQADIEHIEYTMNRDNYRFDITPLGGKMPKYDRIRRLVPVAAGGRLYLPQRLIYIDVKGESHDLSAYLVEEEFTMFPVSAYDDGMDGLARIMDPDMMTEFPEIDDNRMAGIDIGMGLDGHIPMVTNQGINMCQTDYNVFKRAR